MNNSIKTFLKVFLSIIIAGAIIIGIVFAFILTGIIDTTASLNLDDYDLDLSSYVYAYDEEKGEYVDFERLYADENRIWADFEDIPQHVKDAAIAIEDERFYSHNGVDLLSTSKAALKFVFNNSTSRGGSTITQQLVKNLTGDSQKKVSRKLQEMLRAIQLEQKLSKDEILELYLNTFYLGQGCNGIQSASKFYFGKDVSEISIAEGASLVGITQYPTLYDPLQNPDENKKKQELVLGKMYELEYITKEEYEDAMEEELVFVADKDSLKSSRQSYFVDEIIRTVIRDLQEELGYTEAVATKMLYSGGLKIYSTVDPVIQKIATEVFTNEENLKSGPSGTPQASMCIIDPTNGEVKALIGGFGQKTGSLTLNRATQTFRQPGSTIKPISVYGPAVENGTIEITDIFEDKPITMGTWSPKNYYNGFKGKVTLRYAVEQSINTVPVQILQDLGVNKSYDFLTQRLGVTSLVEQDKNLSSLALGGLTNGISNMEITAAYCAFANDGVYHTPITYTKVEDSKGKVILNNSSKSVNAMKSSTARIMNGLLKSVCDQGTGVAARFSGNYTIAGKTGTTDDDKDRWFIGYTPYYCGAVWVGYDTPKTLSFYPSNPTIPLWRKVMEQVHSVKKLKSKSFKYTAIPNVDIPEDPYDVLYNKICSESGMVATSLCPAELVVDGDTTNISEHCNIHNVPPTEEQPEEGGITDEPLTGTEDNPDTNIDIDIELSENGL